MKFISHRGKYLGIREKHPYDENTLQSIDHARSLGFDVEIDVRCINNKFYLGHDAGEHRISIQDLLDRADFLWCHAKNVNTFYILKHYEQLNSFFHDRDEVVLTTRGKLWHFCCSDNLTDESIVVLPETCYPDQIIPNYVYGICSDKIAYYRNRYEQNRTLL